jgi:hypothetical protein
MLFDGNKNVSKTHDDLPSGFVARRACPYRVRSGRSKRSLHRVSKASSYGLPPPYADSALGSGHDRGDCQFVAPTSKRAELHSEAPGLLLVCLALYREHGVGGRFLLQLFL